jgi:hypothetical protein
MFFGIFMSCDCRARAVQPLVAVGMVKMPMRVDQVLDGLDAETGDSFSDPRPRGGDAGIDRPLSLGDCCARRSRSATWPTEQAFEYFNVEIRVEPNWLAVRESKVPAGRLPHPDRAAGGAVNDHPVYRMKSNVVRPKCTPCRST